MWRGASEQEGRHIGGAGSTGCKPLLHFIYSHPSIDAGLLTARIWLTSAPATPKSIAKPIRPRRHHITSAVKGAGIIG